MIYADDRWIGDHGIGRFARHVLAKLDYHPVSLMSHPASPLDGWRLARALRNLTHQDIFFSPGYNTPLLCRSPFIFTIHDLSHIYCPENSSPLIRLYYATVMKRACHRAARILTVSEFTRRQISDWAEVHSEHVVNVSCGVDPAYRPTGSRYELPFEYLLCVSNRKRHKNEFRTLEAFAQSGLAREIHLVFTGNPTGELMECINKLRVGKHVHFIGAVPEAKLPSLYRGAEALVFASLYEGFGLPALEAMACGIPVVTSNVAAMPEVSGGATLLVDPTSIEDIARAMERIVSDIPLRQQLRARGLSRSAQFQWARTVAGVRKVIVARADRANSKNP